MLARRPAVAVTALMYLTLGDTAAALVGVAFGAHPINISETKKKSIEGSLAMFAVCFTSCSIMLADVTLVEYVAVFSALVATLVELSAPSTRRVPRMLRAPRRRLAGAERGSRVSKFVL